MRLLRVRTIGVCAVLVAGGLVAGPDKSFLSPSQAARVVQEPDGDPVVFDVSLKPERGRRNHVRRPRQLQQTVPSTLSSPVTSSTPPSTGPTTVSATSTSSSTVTISSTLVPTGSSTTVTPPPLPGAAKPGSGAIWSRTVPEHGVPVFSSVPAGTSAKMDGRATGVGQPVVDDGSELVSMGSDHRVVVRAVNDVRGAVAVETGGASIGLRPLRPRQKSAPEVQADEVTVKWRKALDDGSDLIQKMTANGAVGQISLASRPTTDAVWEFELAISRGLEPMQIPDGSITVSDGAGQLVGVVPVGEAVDANGVKTMVELQLIAAKNNRWVVSYAVDTDWLDDKSRAFPVLIDPSVYLGQGAYTKYLINSTSAGNSVTVWDAANVVHVKNGPFYLHAGNDAVFIQPDLTGFQPGMTATLVVQRDACFDIPGYAAAGWLRVEAATSAWSPSTLSWAAQPTVGYVGDVLLTSGTYYTAATLDITSFAAKWALGTGGTPGIKVSNLTDNVDCRFSSYSTIVYSGVPNTAPTGSLVAPADNATIASSTAFSVQGSDVDANPLQYWIDVCWPSFAAAVGCYSSGWTANNSFTPPALSAGSVGQWRAFVADPYSNIYVGVRNWGVLVAGPSKLDLVTPGSGAQLVGNVSGTTATVPFTIGAVTGGIAPYTYAATLCENAQPTCILNSTALGAATSFSMALLTGKTYVWNATATDAAGRSVTSTNHWFTTALRANTGPTNAVLTAPDTGATGLWKSPQLSATATDAENDMIKYNFKGCQQAAPTVCFQSGYVPSPWMITPALPDNTTYTWTATAQDFPGVGVAASFTSAESAPWTFTTGTNSLVGDPPVLAQQPATRAGRGASLASLAAPSYTPVAATNARDVQPVVVDITADTPLVDPNSGTTVAPGSSPTTAPVQTINPTQLGNSFLYSYLYGGFADATNFPFPRAVGFGTGHKYDVDGNNYLVNGRNWAAVSNLNFSTFNTNGANVQSVKMLTSYVCVQQQIVPFGYPIEVAAGSAPYNGIDLYRFPGKTGQVNAADFNSAPAINIKRNPSSVETDITDWAIDILNSTNKTSNQIAILARYVDGFSCSITSQQVVMTLAISPTSVPHIAPSPGALTLKNPTFKAGISPVAKPTDPPITYSFNVCQDIAMTKDCKKYVTTPAAGVAPEVTPPVDGDTALFWNQTYYWNVSMTYNSASAPFLGLITTTPPTPFNTSSKDWVGVDPTVAPDLSNAGWTPYDGFDSNDGSFGVNSGTGALIYSESDASIATAGPGLNVTRTYNSNDQRVGVFGKGWSSVLDTRLQLVPVATTTNTTNATGAVVIYPDGRREFHGRNPMINGVITWGDQKGFNARLTLNTASTNFDLTLRDGTVMSFIRQANDSSRYPIHTITDSNTRVVQFTLTSTQATMTDVLSQRSIVANLSASGRAGTIVLRTQSPFTTDSTWTYNYSGNDLIRACRPETGASTVAASCPGTVYLYSYVFVGAPSRLASISRPSGTTKMLVEYNTDGSVSKRTENGVATTFVYEVLNDGGVAVAATDPTRFQYRTTTYLPVLPGTTTADRKRVELYDIQRRLISTINPGQTVAAEKRAYDTAGFLGYVENELGQRVTYENDSRGNVRQMWDPLLRVTKYEYKSTASPDLLTKRTYPTGLFEQWTYDVTRNVLTAKDAAGVTTTNTYYSGALAVFPNDFNLLRTVSTPTVGTTTFTYTAQRDLFTVVSPRGLRQEFGYDGVGRLKTTKTGITGTVAQNVQYGTATISTYDLAGRVKQTVSPEVTNAVTGEVTRLQSVYTYTPDFNGNLANVVATTIHVSGPIPAVAVLPRTVFHGYDIYDRYKSTSDGFVVSYTNYDTVSGVVVSTRDTSNRLTRTDEFYARGTPKKISVVAVGVPRTVQTVNVIDSLGRPVQSTDLLGRVTTIDYAADGQTARVRLTSGASTYLLSQSSFDTAGRVVRTYTDDGLTEVATGYDVNGRIGTVTKVMGGFGANTATDRTTTISYVASGFGAGDVLTTTDPTGAVTTMAYQAGGVVGSVTAPSGVSSFTYDERGLQKTATDITGAVTTTNYDVLGRPISAVLPAAPVNGGVAASPTPKTGLNMFGETTETQDALGNVARHQFNEFGHHLKVKYPTYTPPGGTAITPTESYTYDVNTALLSSVTGRNGAVTNYAYETWADRTQKVSYPDGTFTQYAYDDPANTVTTQTGAGTMVLQTSVSKLDAYNRTFETTQSAVGELSRVSKAEFDGAGRVLRSTDALNYVYANAYDRAGGLLETTAPDATATVTNVFDLLGRLDTSTDALGRIRKTNYGTDQRVASVQSKSAAGVVMESAMYAYNISGRSTTTTNLRGDTTIQFRNALGQTVEARQILTSATDYMSTLYGYDLAGNMTRLTDGRGKLTTYTYNPWNLRQDLVEPGTEPVADRTWTTSYNVAGLPVKDVEPGLVTTVRGYDNMNRLTAVTGTDPDAVNGANASKAFTYDSFGRLATFNVPSGARAVGYSGFGELKSVSSGATVESSFGYDQRGLMSSRVDKAGSMSFSYTPKMELSNVTVAGKGQLQHGWVGGELRTIDYLNPTGGATGVQRKYGYDGVGRLLADVVSRGVSPSGWASYSYDAAGNVLSQQYGLPGNAGAGNHTYAYDSAGRLTGWTKPASPAVSFGYDKAGNRTSAAGVTFTFDDHNRVMSSTDGTSFTYTKRGSLLSETKAAVSKLSRTDALGRVVKSGDVTYAYDGLDRLASRLDSAVGVGQIFGFAGLESDPVSDGLQLFSRSPSGQAVAVGGNTKPFRWVGVNRHGDVTQLLDANQLNPLVGSQTFDPFGQALSVPVTSVGFQGDWTDPTSKQPWMAARWYQPKTGTFTTRDTLLGGIGGPTVGHNRYTYGNNNPNKYRDPTGRFAAIAGEYANDDQGRKVEISYRGSEPWIERAYSVAMNAGDEYSRRELRAVDFLIDHDEAVPVYISDKAMTAAQNGTYGGQSFNDWVRHAAPMMEGSYNHENRTNLKSVFRQPMAFRTTMFVAMAISNVLVGLKYDVPAYRHERYIVHQQMALVDVDGGFKFAQTTFGLGTKTNGLLGDSMKTAQQNATFGALVALGIHVLNTNVAGALDARAAQRTKEMGRAVRYSGNCGNSFRKDTEVLMADGTRKRISAVKIGDEVQTTDLATGLTVIRKVTALHINSDSDLGDLVVHDADGHESTIHTTLHHRFWDDTRYTWVDTSDLTAGDRLHDLHGAIITVAGVVPVHGVRTMYDLTVDRVHSYYVVAGYLSVLVHNCDIGSVDPATVGVEGTDPAVRELNGGRPAAQNFFDEYSTGGTDTTPPGFGGAAGGRQVTMPDGTVINIRYMSGSGDAAVTVNNSFGYWKVHFGK
jgi:RHS repeat-associated protein